jgi:cell division protease FtsH
MVTMYGMNKKIGNVSFYDSKQSEYAFNKPYSESTSSIIDQEVKQIIDISYQRTLDLLTDKRDALEKIAKALLEKEILFQSDLTELIGPRPFEKATHYQEFTTSTGQYEVKKPAPVETPETTPVSASEDGSSTSGNL